MLGDGPLAIHYFLNSPFKGTVRRNPRWVKSGINR
jgi:hypothetical protein